MQNNERREHILEKIFQECVYYCIGNCSYAIINAPQGSHCSGTVLCRKSDPPQVENLASDILFYAKSFCKKHVKKVEQM